MLKYWIAFSSIVGAYLLWQAGSQTSHENGSDRIAYGLVLPVDEVLVTFHVADARGLPIDDLKESEVGLLDNGKPPGKILAFDAITERPLRAGILIDTSDSMFDDLPRIRAIATEFAQNLFRQQSDKAFVMGFAFSSEVVQPWTGDPALLSRSVSSAKATKMNSNRGTALFNAVFHACQYGFNGVDPSSNGNFIMLFSDGEDNAGQDSLEQVLKACQQTNTAIYAFRSRPTEDTDPSGGAVLTALTAESGGRLFAAEGNEQAVFEDLKAIESDLRSEYRLIYRPSHLTRDGSFHSIVMRTPDRVKTIQVRTGYYAPER